jgi:hypothetical protein
MVVVLKYWELVLHVLLPSFLNSVVFPSDILITRVFGCLSFHIYFCRTLCFSWDLVVPIILPILVFY